MGGAFRKQPAPTLYPARQIPVGTNGLEVAIAVAGGIIALSFILILPGIRGWQVRQRNVYG